MVKRVFRYSGKAKILWRMLQAGANAEREVCPECEHPVASNICFNCLAADYQEGG
jgi:hypothetical protein